MILPRNKDLRLRSRKLREVSTPQENHLWYDFLRNYPLRFNRQRIIGQYIVDFYCARARLAIELDGSQHYEARAIEYDAIRTQYLSALDIEVLRFTNQEIDRCFAAVCTQIDSAVKQRVR